MKYHRPEQFAEAQKFLAQDGTQPILIHPRMDVEPYPAADAVVDLSRLNLNYIKHEGDVIRIGAMTTLQDVADSLVLRTLARGILPEAASLTAHLGLRNVSTIGGVIENPSSAVDVMLALLALGVEMLPMISQAEIKVPRLSSGGSFTAYTERDKAIASAANSVNPATTIRKTQFQTEIKFSCPSSNARASLERVARTPKDTPIVAVCMLKDQNATRVAIGGVGIVPTLVNANDPQSSISPLADFRGSVEYQREMVAVLMKRALQRISIG